MRHRLSKLTLALLALGSIATIQSGSAPSGRAIASQQPLNSWTSPWIAWEAYHRGIEFRAEKLTEASVDRLLAKQFGATAAERTAIRTAGRAFVAELQSIDDAARADVYAKYGSDSITPGRKVLVLPSGDSLLQAVKKSGMFDLVERKKEAATLKHHALIKRATRATVFSELEQWVLGPVAGGLYVAELPTPSRADAARLGVVDRSPKKPFQ